ncbi:MAG: hypothetical protein AAF203_03720, partial [Pseudomonadota bacterium]
MESIKMFILPLLILLNFTPLNYSYGSNCEQLVSRDELRIQCDDSCAKFSRDGVGIQTLIHSANGSTEDVFRIELINTTDLKGITRIVSDPTKHPQQKGYILVSNQMGSSDDPTKVPEVLRRFTDIEKVRIGARLLDSNFRKGLTGYGGKSFYCQPLAVLLQGYQSKPNRLELINGVLDKIEKSLFTNPATKEQILKDLKIAIEHFLNGTLSPRDANNWVFCPSRIDLPPKVWERNHRGLACELNGKRPTPEQLANSFNVGPERRCHAPIIKQLLTLKCLAGTYQVSCPVEKMEWFKTQKFGESRIGCDSLSHELDNYEKRSKDLLLETCQVAYTTLFKSCEPFTPNFTGMNELEQLKNSGYYYGSCDAEIREESDVRCPAGFFGQEYLSQQQKEQSVKVV